MRLTSAKLQRRSTMARDLFLFLSGDYSDVVRGKAQKFKSLRGGMSNSLGMFTNASSKNEKINAAK